MIQIARHQKKFNSLHFPETENGHGLDSHSNSLPCVLQLISKKPMSQVLS